MTGRLARHRRVGWSWSATSTTGWTDCRIEADWNEAGEQTAMRCWAQTDEREYEVTGEVLSMIPLRSRRTTPDGNQLHTRITEAMTRYECDGHVGLGMSEFLDQVVDGWPIGVPR